MANDIKVVAMNNKKGKRQEVEREQKKNLERQNKGKKV